MMELFALLMLSYAMTLVSKGTAVSLAVPDEGNASWPLVYCTCRWLRKMFMCLLQMRNSF